MSKTIDELETEYQIEQAEMEWELQRIINGIGTERLDHFISMFN